MFHPMFNPHQQYGSNNFNLNSIRIFLSLAVFPLSTIMWNNPYQQTTMQSPFVQVSA
jgi:hypothetical protein